MNRPIKFRAWVDGLHGKGMYYGSGCYIDQGDHPYLITDNDRIRANVLMQFTGLLDKNKKEIYEHDVLSIPNIQFDPSEGDDPVLLLLVVFEHGAFITKQNGQPCSLSDEVPDVEVIGNVYENPDLSEV
jgi:uncharacterized phage protein (TIGR01671 family)